MESFIKINDRGYYFENESVDCNDDEQTSIPFLNWPINKGDKGEYEINKNICSFLNKNGGIIVLGFNKRCKAVCGVKTSEEEISQF